MACDGESRGARGDRPLSADDKRTPVVRADDLRENDQLMFHCARCRSIRSSVRVQAWPAKIRATPLAELLDAGRLRCERCGDAPASAYVRRIVVTEAVTVFSWDGPGGNEE